MAAVSLRLNAAIQASVAARTEASSMATTLTGVNTSPEPCAFSVQTPSGPLPLTSALTGSETVEGPAWGAASVNCTVLPSGSADTCARPIYAGTALNVQTQGNLTNRQTLAARDSISLSAGGQLTNAGAIEAGVNADGSRHLYERSFGPEGSLLGEVELYC